VFYFHVHEHTLYRGTVLDFSPTCISERRSWGKRHVLLGTWDVTWVDVLLPTH